MRRSVVLASLCMAASMATGLQPAVAAALSDEPLSPLPQNLTFDAGKVALGAKLFADTRFAKDNSISCASCHNLSKGGIDAHPNGRVFSTGAGGAKHILNTPTVYNAGFNFRQQWGGGD